MSRTPVASYPAGTSAAYLGSVTYVTFQFAEQVVTASWPRAGFIQVTVGTVVNLATKCGSLVPALAFSPSQPHRSLLRVRFRRPQGTKRATPNMPLEPTGTRAPVGRVRPGALAPAAQRRSLGRRRLCLSVSLSGTPLQCAVSQGRLGERPPVTVRSTRRRWAWARGIPSYSFQPCKLSWLHTRAHEFAMHTRSRRRSRSI